MLLALLPIAAAHAAEPLTCAGLVAMTTAGVPPDVIRASIRAAGVSRADLSCLEPDGRVLAQDVVDEVRMHLVGDAPAEPAAPRALTLDDAHRLVAEAMAAYRAGDTPTARARLDEAAKAFPADPLVKTAITFLASPVKGVRAGGWTLTADTDEMTGKRRLYAALPAAEAVAAWPRPVRPTMYARCGTERFEVYVALGTVVHSAYGEVWNTDARLRWDEDEAGELSLGIGDDHDTVFFPFDPARFGKLRTSRRLLLELDLYNAGRQVTKFDLTGGNELVGLAMAACGQAL